MSNEASGYVWRCSPFRGATFQVHQAMADSVNDQNNNEFWMAQGALAQKARVDRTTANAALKRLLDGGFIELLEAGGGRSLPSRYRFLFPDAAVVFDSRNRHRKTVGSRNSSPTQTVESPTQTVESGDRHRTQENPREPKRLKAMSQLPADDVDHPDFFDDYFWPKYPSQNWPLLPNPKPGKIEAREQWNRLTRDQRLKALASLPHYRSYLELTGQQTKHCERWLRKRTFNDYEAPPTTPNAAPQGRNARNFDAAMKGLGVTNADYRSGRTDQDPIRGLPAGRVEHGAHQVVDSDVG